MTWRQPFDHAPSADLVSETVKAKPARRSELVGKTVGGISHDIGAQRTHHLLECLYLFDIAGKLAGGRGNLNWWQKATRKFKANLMATVPRSDY